MRVRTGLSEAMRAARLERRAPTSSDRPPLSTFPMTRAAAEALRLDKKKAKGAQSVPQSKRE